MVVNVVFDWDLALVSINNPPVNATSQAVRDGLMDALAQTEAHADVRAVVLYARGRTFTAGADVSEFDKPPVAPHLPDVIYAIEQARKPWVAALHGTVLGGGLELALGCTYRVADAGAVLGFPEVNLGLIPGAGGTVRLPRLVAPQEALTMIAGGRPIQASKALTLGLVDEISHDSVVDAAIAMARNVAGKAIPQRLMSRPALPVADTSAFDAIKAGIRKKARGAHAPIAAIKAVETALTRPPDPALALERQVFLSLKSDPQSAALRHIFFAERASGKLPELKGVAPRDLATIGVVGGGTMGAGIAANCLLRGLNVVLVERDAASAEAGAQRIADILQDSLTRGLIARQDHEAFGKALTTATSYGALSGADLVIEAVFEDMDVKRAVFHALDGVVRPDAILASNTSYLDLNALAASTAKPERVIGLHFFSPAHIMKLLEVVVTDQAAPEVTATAFALGKRLGKIAVPAGVCDGFIGNRIMSRYRRECEYMVDDGALPWDVDAAMRDFGFPMGLFEMQDLAGLDISWAMRKRQAAKRDPAERYVDLGDKLCAAGRFGRKSGAGWYDHESGKPVPSDWVEALILEESERKGISRAPIPATEITARILRVMQAEAQAILDERIARRAEDIDVVMVNGYGFPRWRGGPMFMAAQAGDL